MKNRWNYLGIAATFIAVLVIVLVAVRPGAAQETAKPGELQVTGEGIVSIKPDIAYVTLGVETQASTAKEAQRRNNDVTAKALKALKDLGIASEDIVTSDFSLYPERRYDDGKKQDVLVGYRANHVLRVTVRKIDQTGSVIDALMGAGGNVVQDISFGLADSSSARDAALEKAVKDATRKAEAIARAAGVKLAGIATITDTTAPQATPMTAMRKDFALSASSTPVATGSVQVRTSVQMTFRF